MWLIKNNVRINWPHYIMQHIIKCPDNKMPLQYANLITRILQVYGFDLSNEQAIMLGWNHYFGKKSMTKLNILQVNDIWQLGRPHHAHEENDEEDELSVQDVEGGQGSKPHSKGIVKSNFVRHTKHEYPNGQNGGYSG